MNKLHRVAVAIMLLSLPLAAQAQAQAEATDDREGLRMAALEALISAPPERALPIVDKVLAGNNSTELKERALFILSQMGTAESQSRLVTLARDASGELQLESIRMIGISGDDEALAGLGDLYRGGDENVQEAVLEAYMIASDTDALFNIAMNAENEQDFSEAVQMLGALGAQDHLRELRGRNGLSESLIEAYALSGDAQTLREVALDGSNVEMQRQAIEALGIVGGDDVGDTLVSIYRDAGTADVRESALQGLLIAGHDAGVLSLYRSAEQAAEKRQLLEYLVMMDSDEVWDLIDSALDGAQ